MNNIMSRIAIIVASVLVLIIFGGLVLWHYGVQVQSIPDNTAQDSEENNISEFTPLHVPTGWKTYVSSDEWQNENRIALAYPSDWEVEEQRVTVFEGQPREYVRLDRVVLSGDGYEVQIHQKGGAASPDWSSKEVGGYNARTWVFETGAENGLEYGTTLGIMDTGFIITVWTSDKTMQIFDQIVSTIEFNLSL